MFDHISQTTPEGVGRRRFAACLLAVLAVLASQAVASAAVGNISPLAIEIDSPSANLHPGGSTVACASQGASLPSGTDWVADCAANNDTASLVDSVATGLIPNVTSKPGGFGHWRGVRIVDGVGGADQDIFLTGGKENDTSTWNVGPGSIGSAKYDATQAYLANNQTHIFFGMERRGNNGTTAFDFEFNQFGSAGGYIPTRTVGDVLLTFEMQGAGNSGSAEVFYFMWNGTKYNGPLPLPAGTTATINTNTTTPAAPWGHVDSKGNWTGGDLERFEFAEARVPISILPGVDACGGAAFVQVRTRSSSTENSDLKDTTKIFEFLFATPTAGASKTAQDGMNSTVTLTGSSSGLSNPTYQWQRKSGNTWVDIAGATGSSLVYSAFESHATATATGTFSIASGDGSGTYVGKVYTVLLRVRASDGTCSATSSAVTVKKVVAVDP